MNEIVGTFVEFEEYRQTTNIFQERIQFLFRVTNLRSAGTENGVITHWFQSAQSKFEL